MEFNLKLAIKIRDATPMPLLNGNNFFFVQINIYEFGNKMRIRRRYTFMYFNKRKLVTNLKDIYREIMDEGIHQAKKKRKEKLC